MAPERKKPIGGAETFSGPGGKKATDSAKIVTEDYGAVLLHLSGGARGVFHVMQMHAGRKNLLYLEVCGSEGSMVRGPRCFRASLLPTFDWRACDSQA